MNNDSSLTLFNNGNSINPLLQVHLPYFIQEEDSPPSECNIHLFSREHILEFTADLRMQYFLKLQDFQMTSNLNLDTFWQKFQRSDFTASLIDLIPASLLDTISPYIVATFSKESKKEYFHKTPQSLAKFNAYLDQDLVNDLYDDTLKYIEIENENIGNMLLKACKNFYDLSDTQMLYLLKSSCDEIINTPWLVRKQFHQRLSNLITNLAPATAKRLLYISHGPNLEPLMKQAGFERSSNNQTYCFPPDLDQDWIDSLPNAVLKYMEIDRISIAKLLLESKEFSINDFSDQQLFFLLEVCLNNVTTEPSYLENFRKNYLHSIEKLSQTIAKKLLKFPNIVDDYTPCYNNYTDLEQLILKAGFQETSPKSHKYNFPFIECSQEHLENYKAIPGKYFLYNKCHVIFTNFLNAPFESRGTNFKSKISNDSNLGSSTQPNPPFMVKKTEEETNDELDKVAAMINNAIKYALNTTDKWSRVNYTAFELESNPTQDAKEKKFRKLSQKYHPDKQAEKYKPYATRIFKELANLLREDLSTGLEKS